MNKKVNKIHEKYSIIIQNSNRQFVHLSRVQYEYILYVNKQIPLSSFRELLKKQTLTFGSYTNIPAMDNHWFIDIIIMANSSAKRQDGSWVVRDAMIGPRHKMELKGCPSLLAWFLYDCIKQCCHWLKKCLIRQVLQYTWACLDTFGEFWSPQFSKNCTRRQN